jgi:hypothetical protein
MDCLYKTIHMPACSTYILLVITTKLEAKYGFRYLNIVILNPKIIVLSQITYFLLLSNNLQRNRCPQRGSLHYRYVDVRCRILEGLQVRNFTKIFQCI